MLQRWGYGSLQSLVLKALDCIDHTALPFDERDPTRTGVFSPPRKSKPRRLTKSWADEINPAWSRDGKKIACKPERIFHADENSGRTQELALSPDARKLAFAHVDRGDLDIYTINADGTDLRQLTVDDRINSSSPSWSPDGRQLAFSDGDAIYVMNADGSNQRNISQNAKKKDHAPRWSPAA